MARPIRMLSINFPFRNQNITCDDTLATARALFNFDVVVIRPYGLLARAADDWGLFERLQGMFDSKRDDLNRLFRLGGVLVVILDLVSVVQYHTGTYSYTGGTLYAE